MLRHLLMTFILLVGVFNVKAETVLEAQLNLEERLTKIVQSVDERAYVFVTLEEDQKKLKLPSTPFIFETANLDFKERVKLKSMTVTIMTRMGDFPESIEKVIQNVTSEYGVTAKIEKVVVPIKDFSKPTEAKTADEGDKAKDEATDDKAAETEPEKQVSKIASYMDYVFAGGLGIGLLLFAFFIMTQRKSNQISLEVLKEQMGKLGSSFENASMGGGAVEVSSSQNDSGGGTSGKIELNTSSSSIWETFDKNSVEAIMADCYWCMEDEYASYVWDKLSIERRVELLNGGVITHEYATYICTLEGVDKEYAKDPYYLAPINVNHLSNEAIVEMLGDSPGLMNKLSKMRQKTLPIKATERLKLAQNKAPAMVDLSVVESHEKSHERVIKTKETFTFASIEEEKEIIEMTGYDLDVMERFPSLAWILNLESDQISNLLSEYTAKQLAAIWIGPEDVLSKLEANIPEKKAALMKSYLDKVTPMRTGIYNQLINQALTELRDKESGVQEVKQAA